VFDFYGLPPPEPAGRSVAEWLQACLQRPPVAGDTVDQGTARFSVRRMEGGRIVAVGLRLPEPE